MLHPVFITIFSIAIAECLVLVFLAILCFRKRTVLSSHLGFIFVFATMTLFGNVHGFISGTESVSKYFYFLYYAGNTLMLNALYFFCVRFSGIRMAKSYSKEVAFAISTIDIIVMLILTILGKYSQMNCLIYYGKLVYKPVSWHWYFNVHLGISYLYSLGTICLLIYKACSTPKHNRSKYVNILLIFVALLTINAICLIFSITFDITTYFLGLSAIFVYFFCYLYRSRHYLLHTIQTVANDSKRMMICFDESDKCVWLNSAAKDFFPDVKDLYNFMEKEFEKWKTTTSRFDEIETDFSWISRVTHNGQRYDLRIGIRKKYDELDNYLGCYFIADDITQELKLEENQKRLMGMDSLTGIPNRDFYFAQVKKTIKIRSNTSFLMVCSNIVDFKIYNNIFGETAGNNVLKRNAEYISKHKGVAPAFGRISGDMFSMILEEDHFREEPFIEVMHQIEKEFSNNFFSLHMQMGVYKITNINEPVSSMVEKAILAMKTSKADFSKRVSWYYEDTLSSNLREKLVMSKFEQSLKNGEFKMFIQPQVTQDNKVIGGEALARWIDIDGNIIPPYKFIPILENNGMITRLDKYIWEEAAKQLERWKNKGRDDLHISVNISVKDFYHDDLYQTFTGLVEKYNIDPSKLKLEITETALISDTAAINTLLQKLRQFGFKVELDDFGSGYSSLGLLKDISVDTIKIDMSFLSRSKENTKEKSWLILNEIIRLAKVLDMKTVIEGVEEEEQVRNLSEFGCDIFQGYYFAKPETVTSFEERVHIIQ
ncbi:MAG: EAL domain-containing protein [Treponema sp.]|nr:EAL domain-containing protein [Treponema sp.]